MNKEIFERVRTYDIIKGDFTDIKFNLSKLINKAVEEGDYEEADGLRSFMDSIKPHIDRAYKLYFEALKNN